jgi:two-component sensor histidine kinase
LVNSLADRLPGDVVDELELLVTELVTNSIRHASFDSGESVSIRVARPDSDRVVVSVCDPGGATLPHRSDLIDLEQTGGRGLLLVDLMAERWGVQSGSKTCVWFELVLDEAHADA